MAFDNFDIRNMYVNEKILIKAIARKTNQLNAIKNGWIKKRNVNYGWGKSGYKGIYKKGNLYIASMTMKNGSKKQIGSFETAEEAARHYDYFSFREFSHGCYLNFPNENYHDFKPNIVDRRKYKRKNCL